MLTPIVSAAVPASVSSAPAPNGAVQLVMDVLAREVVGNTIQAWGLAILTVILVLTAFWIARWILAARLKKLAARTTTRLDDLAAEALYDIRPWCVGMVAIYSASQALVLPGSVAKGLKILTVSLVAIQILIISQRVISRLIAQAMEKNRQPDGKPDPSLASATTIIRFMATIVIGAILLLLALDNLGVEITPLITGLGIGGIAVALAAQSILGDLFASLSILFDKPFLVGDFIIVGEHLGTVERIGVKSTLVRSLSGEQIIFRNTDLLSSRVRNYGRLKERRILFAFGVIYETKPAALRKIPQIVQETILSVERTRFDRCHFKAFGAYSLDFEVVYFVLVPDFNVYMDIQQAINLALFERFAAEGISFAYPTQVEIHRLDAASSAAASHPAIAASRKQP
jgi:small-conductance mechanosensitive channel